MPTDKLDGWFGPRTVVETDPSKPFDRLRPFLDEFEGWMQLARRPSPQIRALWASGARDWVEAFGEGSIGTYRDAMTYCKRHGIEPKSPKGLIFYGLRHFKKEESVMEKYGACPICSRAFGTHEDGCPTQEKPPSPTVPHICGDPNSPCDYGCMERAWDAQEKPE